MDLSKNLDFDYNTYNLNNYKDFEYKDEYKKEINNLKNNLQKKEYELTTVNSLYQELKKLNEQLRQECENLNEKNILLINDKSLLEKKYETEIENLELKYKKKINDYEIQISNFSSFNMDHIRIKTENDCKEKYEEIIFNKDKEILEKNQIIEQLKNDINYLEENFQFEKESLLKDMNTIKNLHKTETNDLLQRIQLLKNNSPSNANIDNGQFLHIKNELNNVKRQINLLNSENFKLKKDNESLIKEKNELKTNNILLNDKLKIAEKKNEFEFKRLNNNIENLKLENNTLKNEAHQNESKIKEFYIEKKNLKNEISHKTEECQQLQNEINILNDLLKTHQDEFDKNLIDNYKIKNELYIEGRKNEEKFKKQIEDLNMKLRDNINYEDFEEIINNKEEEIDKLRNKIKEIESDVVVDANLMKKYNEMIKKKNFYKNQCKQANEKIDKIIKKLNPEQLKEFESLFNTNKNNNIFEISQSGAV